MSDSSRARDTKKSGSRRITGLLLIAISLALSGCGGSKQDSDGKSVSFQGKTKDGTQVQMRVATDANGGGSIKPTDESGAIAFALLQKALQSSLGTLTLEMNTAVAGSNKADVGAPEGYYFEQLSAGGSKALPANALASLKTGFAALGIVDLSYMNMTSADGTMIMISNPNKEYDFQGHKIKIVSIQIGEVKGGSSVTAMIVVKP